MGRPNSCLQEKYSGPLPRAKKALTSMRYRPGVKYIQAVVGRRKNNAMTLKNDSSTEEQLQFRKQYTCSPHGTLSPATAMPAHRILEPWCFEAMHEATGTNNVIMRYYSSLTVAIRLGFRSQKRER